MKKVAILLVFSVCFLVGCYNERIDRMDKRLNELEDNVLRLQDEIEKMRSARPGSKGAGGMDREKIVEALKKLKEIAERRSYREDPEGKAGEGAFDIKAMDTEDVMAGSANKYVGGVSVEIDGKNVGVTKKDMGLVVRGLKPGPKTVRFSKAGYQDFVLEKAEAREKQIKMVTGAMKKLP